MKQLEQAEVEKTTIMRRINHLLYQARHSNNKHIFNHDYQKIVHMEPTIYITIYTHLGEDMRHDKKGYVIDLDKCSFKPIGARYFSSCGIGTYREVDLATREFRDLVRYYDLDKMDAWFICHDAIK